MRVVKIDESNCDAEYRASTEAIRDFLYMYFDIVIDCAPIGDWDRAELGEVDPFRYLDVSYECIYSFRSLAAVAFLHEGAAVNLLCRLAQVLDVDDCSGSAVVDQFAGGLRQGLGAPELQSISPELLAVHQAYVAGRVARLQPVEDALQAIFAAEPERFYSALTVVRRTIIMPALSRVANASQSTLADDA